MNAAPVLTVVIPTRNRSEFAGRAVESALAEAAAVGATVLVSDNSTDAGERRLLYERCRRLGTARLRYVTPPEPLAMSPHWEWALGAALDGSDATHVLYLTDRMIFRPGELARVAEAVAVEPDRVLSYNNDLVDDARRPIVVQLEAWSGRVVRVDTSRLLDLAARSIFSRALPRMLNSVAPRSVLDELRVQFGSVFESISPDYAFAFRCLAAEREVLFYDAPVVIAYGLDRSNGTSVTRGVETSDTLDFLADLGDVEPNYAAPVPGFRLGANGMIHEYCVARDLVDGSRFPPVRRGRYLARMARDAKLVEDPVRRRQVDDLLRASGWSGWRRGAWSAVAALEILAYYRDAHAILRRVVARLGETPAGRRMLARSRRLSIGRPPTFDDVDSALAFAAARRGPRLAKSPRL